MITDPIADMINRIKTAQAVSKKTVKVPFSKLKYEIAKTLENKGWVNGVEKKGRDTDKYIEIELKYVDGEGFIRGIKRKSTPGQRIYSAVSDIRRVKDGAGISIISTSKGLMTNYEARKANLGGEILIEIY
ncbi:MAG: 30S ribosomal protein S8 [Candidatus Pacebacteria bacterium]|nr:30S ribosomal protein S8 [Candidatus Paceibacterota bacterium]